MTNHHIALSLVNKIRLASEGKEQKQQTQIVDEMMKNISIRG